MDDHTEEFGTNDHNPAILSPSFLDSSTKTALSPEGPGSSPRGRGPTRSSPVGLQCDEEKELDDQEQEECLNEFQRTMKMEHRQALKNTHRGCVILERHRRKRITQSCSRLRQLLPTIPGGRVDMVTVLEMTVAYLETIKQVSAQRSDVQLCPPGEVHAKWLMQSHMTRDQGHKLATELESKLRSQVTPKERRWTLRKRRSEKRCNR